MKIKNMVLNVVLVFCILIIVVTVCEYIVPQITYAQATNDVKDELRQDLPVCTNGEMTTTNTTATYDYQPDELMGSIYFPKFDLIVPLYLENEADTTDGAIDKGAAMDVAGSYPYGNEATVIYGHNYYDFEELQNIAIGDPIIVTVGQSTYLYGVTSTEIIGDTESDEVFTEENELVLYTCYPFIWGVTAVERFVVHAQPVASISC